MPTYLEAETSTQRVSRALARLGCDISSGTDREWRVQPWGTGQIYFGTGEGALMLPVDGTELLLRALYALPEGAGDEAAWAAACALAKTAGW